MYKKHTQSQHKTIVQKPSSLQIFLLQKCENRPKCFKIGIIPTFKFQVHGLNLSEHTYLQSFAVLRELCASLLVVYFFLVLIYYHFSLYQHYFSPSFISFSLVPSNEGGREIELELLSVRGGWSFYSNMFRVQTQCHI